MVVVVGMTNPFDDDAIVIAKRKESVDWANFMIKKKIDIRCVVICIY